MKSLFGLILILGLSLSGGSSSRESNLFQVITGHPHDIEELSPHVETVFQKGRLWVVDLKSSAPMEVKKHLRVLSGKEKHFLYEGMFISNKVQKGRKVNISKFVSQVSKENIKKDIENLSSFETRFVATPENTLALEQTASRLASLGYSVQEHCYRDEVCSLIAEKKGNKKSDQVLLIMGHIDSIGEAFAGADDNASGMAALLEMARILGDFDNEKTIRFFVTNGEETGLIGSTHYARSLERSGEIQNIKFALNMDMIGFNGTGIVEIETDPKYEENARLMGDLASKFTSLKTKISLGAWGSDHLPFLQRGVPSLLTIQDWETKNPCYHQECDKIDLINFDYVAEITKLNLSTILYLDQQ